MAWYDPRTWVDNSNVPTQFRDRDRVVGLINSGFGQGGAAPGAMGVAQGIRQGGGAWGGGGAAGGQNITNQTAQQADTQQLQLGADPFRAGQLQQVGQLQQIISGQAKGAGELATERQIAQAQAAQQAQARMARGGNAALAYRNAANQAAALGSTGAGMGQRAALQDQTQAQGVLAGALGQGRGADISVAGQNANLGQQTSLANAQARQQQQQQNAANYLALLQQLQQMNATELGAAQAPVMEGNKNKTALLGGILGGGSQIGAVLASDERLKTDVSDAGAEVDDMLDAMRTVAWRYKDPKHGEGRFTGTMAQDLERSEAGRRIVRDTPEGKMLDMKQALSGALASVARLNQRLRAVEGR